MDWNLCLEIFVFFRLDQRGWSFSKYSINIDSVFSKPRCHYCKIPFCQGGTKKKAWYLFQRFDVVPCKIKSVQKRITLTNNEALRLHVKIMFFSTLYTSSLHSSSLHTSSSRIKVFLGLFRIAYVFYIYGKTRFSGIPLGLPSTTITKGKSERSHKNKKADNSKPWLTEDVKSNSSECCYYSKVNQVINKD